MTCDGVRPVLRPSDSGDWPTPAHLAFGRHAESIDMDAHAAFMTALFTMPAATELCRWQSYWPVVRLAARLRVRVPAD